MTTRNHERMSSVDTAWLRMDGPGNSMMIVGVSATATPIRPDDFRRMIEQRLLCFSRFRHRPVPDALGASWVEDQEFDLDAHVKTVVLPEPAQGPAREAGGRARQHAARSAPADVAAAPGRALQRRQRVITRVHHCYADGIAMLRVVLSMTEQDPGPALGARRAPARRPTDGSAARTCCRC